ncbi:hypothetical protein PMIN03_006300 [Paraphaeosphaeria minitans]
MSLRSCPSPTLRVMRITIVLVLFFKSLTSLASFGSGNAAFSASYTSPLRPRNASFGDRSDRLLEGQGLGAYARNFLIWRKSWSRSVCEMIDDLVLGHVFSFFMIDA